MWFGRKKPDQLQDTLTFSFWYLLKGEVSGERTNGKENKETNRVEQKEKNIKLNRRADFSAKAELHTR